jgi:regulator of RNase E activity RraA
LADVKRSHQQLKQGFAALNAEFRSRFARLTTAHIADACVRAEVKICCAPPAVQALVPGSRIAGLVMPVRHFGSVDIFLEAINVANAGDVLVIDNNGRLDEACIGDLIALEVQTAGLSGIVIWGLHRDSAEIRSIGLPVFSLGATPAGPQRLDSRDVHALRSVNVGERRVNRNTVVFGDDDGVLFVPKDQVLEILTIAETIRDTEQPQADRVREGEGLRRQLHFDAYLAARKVTPSLTFREHLRSVGGAVEV